jgi:hypothetical protein
MIEWKFTLLYYSRDQREGKLRRMYLNKDLNICVLLSIVYLTLNIFFLFFLFVVSPLLSFFFWDYLIQNTLTTKRRSSVDMVVRTKQIIQSRTSYWVENSLNLNILLSEGNKTLMDSFSSGERTRKSPRFKIGRFIRNLLNCSLMKSNFILVDLTKWPMKNGLQYRVIVP